LLGDQSVPLRDKVATGEGGEDIGVLRVLGVIARMRQGQQAGGDEQRTRNEVAEERRGGR
jgi:hypothetical protein